MDLKYFSKLASTHVRLSKGLYYNIAGIQEKAVDFWMTCFLLMFRIKYRHI